MSELNTAYPASRRDCPRCGNHLEPERFVASEGVTWLWRCDCGWSGAVAESGILSRGRARQAIERARTGEDGD